MELDRQTAEATIDAVCNAKVDTSWLTEFDLGLLLGVECLAMRETMSIPGDEGILGEETDEFFYAKGISSALARFLYAARDTGDQDYNLFVLLLALSQQAYNYGVRDAVEGRLSKTLQHSVAQRVGRADEKFEKLMAFHDEISGL